MISTSAGNGQEEVQESVLVEQAQRGDVNAFEVLVIKHQPAITRMLVRYLRDKQDALDATQEVLVRAWRSLPNFRGKCKFYTWLYRIAINVAQSIVDSRKKEQQRVDANSEEQVSGIESPEKQVDTKPMEMVNEVLRGLPTSTREAYCLREIEGHSYEDISQILKCPPGTVRSRIFRARTVLEKALQDLFQEDGRIIQGGRWSQIHPKGKEVKKNA